MTRSALLFGARSQVGRFLLPRLQDAGWSTRALSRRETPSAAASLTRWQRFDLCDGSDLDGEFEVIFSLGPLDAFAAWWQRSAAVAARVIAMSSTSAASKTDSPDPAERDLSDRLHRAENAVVESCARRGASVTLLRPTLIYGGGADRSLSRIAQMARRWHFFALPQGATGLRQPVHADDLAAAAWAAAQRNSAQLARYDLPGGETLTYREMVRRVLDCLDRRPRLIELPRPAFTLTLSAAHRLGWLRDAGIGVLGRLQTDLVFDATPARHDLGYAPRHFAPTAEMFVAEETR